MEGSVDGTVAIVGAVQEEERHQDEDGQEDHHPVALWSLQCKQEQWVSFTKYKVLVLNTLAISILCNFYNYYLIYTLILIHSISS